MTFFRDIWKNYREEFFFFFFLRIFVETGVFKEFFFLFLGLFRRLFFVKATRRQEHHKAKNNRSSR